MPPLRPITYPSLALALAATACTPAPPTAGERASSPHGIDRGETVRSWDYFVTGTPGATAPRPVSPGLLLMGGGGDVDAAMRWFLERAGGGNIVVLRAAGGDGYHDYLYRELGRIQSVETIVFRDRAAAFDPAVAAILSRAHGIFLAGGDQSRYVRFWSDTPVAAALAAHWQAGRPLGGTSAGLAVLGEFAFSADFDPRTSGGELTSRAAQADPHDPRITLVRGFLSLPPLRGTIADTHFAERDRFGRLEVFVSRILARDDAPAAVLGIGIDEATALCLEPDGTGRVLSARGGAVHLLPAVRGQSPGPWHRVPAGSALRLGDWLPDRS